MAYVPRPDLVEDAQGVICDAELSRLCCPQIIGVPQENESIRKSAETVIKANRAQEIVVWIAAVEKPWFEVLPSLLRWSELKQLMTRDKIKLVLSDLIRQIFANSSEER